MMSKLIIVESPSKIKTVKKRSEAAITLWLQRGHVRDLPKSKLGIDVEHDFKTEYINMSDKKDLIKGGA